MRERSDRPQDVYRRRRRPDPVVAQTGRRALQIQAGRSGPSFLAEDYPNETSPQQFAAVSTYPVRRHACRVPDCAASQSGHHRPAARGRLRLVAADQAGARRPFGSEALNVNPRPMDSPEARWRDVDCAGGSPVNCVRIRLPDAEGRRLRGKGRARARDWRAGRLHPSPGDSSCRARHASVAMLRDDGPGCSR